MPTSRLHRRLVTWLGRFRVRHSWWCLAGGIGVTLVAALAWLLTFWVFKFLLWFAGSWILATPASRSIGAVALCGVLIVLQRLVQREQFEELRVDHPVVADALRTAAWITGDALVVLAGPATMSSGLRILLMMVLTGPRFTQLAIELFRRSYVSAVMNVEASARILAVVLKSDRKVPLEELMQRFPEFHWRTALREITLVDGVLVRLENDPLISIADSSRQQLIQELEAMSDEAPPEEMDTSEP